MSAKNPVCDKFLPALSAAGDGELPPSALVALEAHLASCESCARRATELRSVSALLRGALEARSDEVDFTKFSRTVLARLPSRKPALGERLRFLVEEMVAFPQRWKVAAIAVAMLAALVALPFLLNERVPLGYANAVLRIEAFAIDDTEDVEPRLVEDESGDAIVWAVEHHHAGAIDAEEAPADATSDEVAPEPASPESEEEAEL